MVHSCQQLHVHGKTTVKVSAGFGDQTHCELSLEHEHGASENRSVLQKFEDQGRRDLVRRVRDAYIKEGELDFDGIACNELELVLVSHIGDSLGHFSHHTRIDFDGNDLFAAFEKRRSQITCTRTDF